MTGRIPILFFGEALSLAHVTRPLVLARSLDPETYEIHFACDTRYQELVDIPSHIRLWPLGSISNRSLTSTVDRGRFHLSQADLKDYVSEELSLLQQVRPALVVSDFRPTVSISAELTGTAHAALANVVWSPFRMLDFDPNPDSGALPGKGLLAGSKSKNTPSATESINSVRRQYGLPLVQGYCEIVTRGDYTLYVDPPAFVDTKPLPDNHMFLGPIWWSPDVSKPSWWRCWDPDLPLIYVTLGSTGRAALLPTLVHSLQDLSATILVASAGRGDLGEVPENVFVADYVPGLEATGYAAVTVCNGGSTTAYQSLNHGTPIVGLWSNLDQYLTSSAIKRAGAGESCHVSAVDASGIRQLVLSVSEDRRYQTAAKRLSQDFNACDAGENFRRFIETHAL